jgi:hypothetical protein
MAIQDLINEVNSIQTKKKAIKEAITAKGVTSEGKLSKFADEIKQITASEPDWYIVNKFRYDNGNEALFVRTSDKNAVSAYKYQMVEIGGGVMKSNSISNSFNYSYNDDIGIINGTYFPRETAYRSFSTFETSSVVFDGHNDNLKLSLQNGKDIVFNDVNAYNWLKGYRNQPLADFNTLYLKSDGISGKAAKTLKDFLASSNETRMSTLGKYGQNPFLLIDSSIMIQAMNLKKMSKTGFIYYSDKTVDPISLHPVLYYGFYDKMDIPFYENKEKYYGNLSPGNYVHLFSGNNFLIAFVSINFVVDSNGQKHKNIEVYIYSIVALGGTKISRITDKPFELYLTFSNQAQQQLQQASDIKIFRRQVLAANGTPEPRASNFLTGNDALLEFSAYKITNGRLPVRNTTANLFKKNSRVDNIFRYQTSIFEGGYIATSLVEDIRLNKKIAGFIRLNDDSNTMFPIELEKVPDEIKNNPKISYYRQYSYFLSCIAPNGILLERNNKMMVFVKDIQGDITCFYVKKGNDYITNDMLSTNPKNTQLYITSDTESQQYLTTKPLSNVWTEINSLNKDDFEAYGEE